MEPQVEMGAREGDGAHGVVEAGGKSGRRAGSLGGLRVLALFVFLGAVAACQADSVGVEATPAPLHAGTADTLVVETWESGDLGQWEDVGRRSLVRVVHDPDGAAAGRRYARLEIPAGEPGPWLTRWFMPGTDTDEIYTRYRIRYPADWVGGIKNLRIRGSRVDDRWSAFGTAGTSPRGDDFFSAGPILLSLDAPNESVLFYSYHPEMPPEPDGTTFWGDTGRRTGVAEYSPVEMRRETWHTVEFWLRLNTPGSPDGEMRLWVDGEPRGVWSNLRLRDVPGLRINSVMLDASTAGYRPDVDRRLDLDDVLVLTRHPDPDW